MIDSVEPDEQEGKPPASKMVLYRSRKPRPMSDIAHPNRASWYPNHTILRCPRNLVSPSQSWSSSIRSDVRHNLDIFSIKLPSFEQRTL